VTSIPNREILLEAGRALRAAGASFLQAPCFDPKVREHCAGLGIDPLVLLEEIGGLAGIGVAVEILHPADVDRAVQRADMLVVPALHMQNAELLHEVGRVDRPVILERAPMASMDEWLAAAELVLGRGNHRVILCERGIRTFERVMPSTLDLGAVAVLRERTHLPIFVDPSQAAGKARWAMALAQGARAVGAHGVTLTVAVDALDAQALTVSQFGELVQRLSQLPAR
jgi:3-deoxy-7-phosphoheptulonate synthase